jgi:dipeptidyl aminopeptidase/acylaminoacyl peptidase
MLFHGDQDPQMPINQSHELEGAYERQGLQVDFIVVHGAAHGGDAFYSPENVERVVTFLDAQLRRGGAASAVPARGATSADRI